MLKPILLTFLGPMIQKSRAKRIKSGIAVITAI
jgi:hypothetical protein